MSSTTYLVTGVNSGIGKELLSTLLQRPNTTVVGGVRSPTSAVSQALTKLPAAEGSRFILVQIDSTSETDAKDAVELLKSKHNIQALDVVIANAGVGKDYGPIAEKSLSDMREHFEVNTIGTLVLFQAVLPLLEAAQTPKFVPISTVVGSIGELEKTNFPTVAYGASKAALNYITKKTHLEYPDIIAFPIHPGWVETDMGNRLAEKLNMERAPLTARESVDGMLKTIDNATRSETSGTFQSYNGSTLLW